MKKLIPMIFCALIALNTYAINTRTIKPEASAMAVPTTTAPAAEKENKLNDVEAKRLVERLKEIRDMDKKNMTRDEKRELKKEVTTIKETLQKEKRSGGGLYISTGAIIIILLLIIIL